jgi:serine phosphatase RsbU (regulator of sigma subunit)
MIRLSDAPSVESREHQGGLILPARSSEVSAPASLRASLDVLLIEDDDDDALIVEDMLADSASEISLARGRTLQAGLEQLPGGFNCVLLDLRLPDVVGLDAVARLRAAVPQVAVIVFTGLDDEAAGEAAVESGAQDYLVKGKVDGGLLSRAIRYAVGRRHAEDVDQQLRVAEILAEENARLQRGLVPHPTVTDPSLWIAASYLPGRRRALLGGDFYDAVQTGDGRLDVIIGDVSGRGPDEAALGANLRIAWHALTQAGTPGDRILPTMQQMIERERQAETAFATLCSLEIHAHERTLTVRRAGHPAPLLISGTSIKSLPLDGGGPPIGMFDGGQWPGSQFELPPGWSILLYTDGVIERRNVSGGLLGEDGLRRLIGDYIDRVPDWPAEPHSLLAEVVTRVRELHPDELSDDVAMVLLGSREPA